jgi:hypothetical protein
LSSFSSSLEQYKQPINWFDGLEANAKINEFVRYDRMADRPAWYNRVPIAYIQRIIVKSVIHIPEPSASDANETQKLFLIDTFRTPLAHLFELNQFIKNFQTKKYSLVGDLCVHVGELNKNDNFKYSGKKTSSFNKHYLPEFNCLYLSPANFWLNNVDVFDKDEDLMNTINELVPIYLQKLNPNNSNSNNNNKQQTNQNEQNMSTMFVKIWNSLHSTSGFFSKTTEKDSAQSRQKTNIRDLLFGVSWSSVFKSLEDDPILLKKLNQINKSVSFSHNLIKKI